MEKYSPEQLDRIFGRMREIFINPAYKLKAIEMRDLLNIHFPPEIDSFKEDISLIKNDFVRLNKRIKDIEKCLGIDFQFDEQIQIDYDFIGDALIRDKITAYYREMLRYQFGTRNHKVCFGEFCRFATIQLEFMLNYFFADERKIELIQSLLDEIAEKLQRKDNGIKDLDYYKKEIHENPSVYISNISLSKKSRKFYDTYLDSKRIGDNKISYVSFLVADMRNRKSHGSVSTIDPYENEYLTDKEKDTMGEYSQRLNEKIEEYNKNNKERNTIIFEGDNLKVYNKMQEPMRIIPAQIWEIYSKMKKYIWINKKPFDEVLQLLRIVAGTCAKELKNKS